jgi:serine/threonine-protein kinase RsbW
MQEPSTMRVKAVLKNVSDAMAFAAQRAREAGLEEVAVKQVQLAVDEACANVVDHAYDGLLPGDMEIVCGLDGLEFVVLVRDWGQRFDPDEVAVPDVTAPLDERSLGGLGLFLIHQVMDRIEYRSDPKRGNELLMAKRAQVGV